MTDQQLASNYPISSLTVSELESLITKIVQKVIREENSREKLGEEVVQFDISDSYDANQQPRPYGQWRGQVHMSNDFDVLPESIAAAFAGEME
ncbi:hypothetical protein DSM106972_030570 [Dulcicalothrix desertica PCC 7102]|uniref:Uncharacterized protein n=1 Tax=Dulcicalothrix desertica PCC 7102 TaxID=232991 RepID=A0A3S1DBE5_9CYAN|nr:hypothetical protein [Dulcicalothrix desertica]RUT06800.1 hypothetical protein DSM106972_030570 [Dulcicalothrix desertica PCC 7102]TWH50090.1 hypothetical protein CAL7102_04374 [Dulcicalothrix desertica PCC 7102]